MQVKQLRQTEPPIFSLYKDGTMGHVQDSLFNGNGEHTRDISCTIAMIVSSQHRKRVKFELRVQRLKKRTILWIKRTIHQSGSIAKGVS